MDLYAMVKNAKAYFTIDVNWHILSWINYGFFGVCFVLLLSIDHVSQDIRGMLPLTDEADEFHWLHHMELMQEPAGILESSFRQLSPHLVHIVSLNSLLAHLLPSHECLCSKCITTVHRKVM